MTPLMTGPGRRTALPVPVTAPAVLGVLVALVAVASTTASISAALLQQHRTATSSFAGVRSVDADTGSGNVTVVADTGGAVRVERRQTWSFGRPSSTEQVAGGVLRLRARCGSWLGSCSVSYVVHVPAGTPVRARSGSGDIRASGTGRLDAQSGSGNVRATRVTGDVTLHAGSGDVRADGVRGDVRLSTGSGDVRAGAVDARSVTARTGSGNLRVVLTRPPDRLALTTGSGDLTALLPDDGTTAYAVSASTGSGDSDVRIRTDRGAPRVVTARTGSGDLHLRYSAGR